MSLHRSIGEQKKFDAFIEYSEYEGKNKSKKTWLNLRNGAKIHLHTLKGMFTVICCSKYRVQITCKRWQYEFDRGQRKSSTEWVRNDDVKCLAGGLWNFGK